MAWDSDLGNEPPPATRAAPPDLFAPIDPDAPVSGHRPPKMAASPADAPEHDWAAAEPLLFPMLRPVGTSGARLDQMDPDRLSNEGRKTHPTPLIDDGPDGLKVGYILRAGSFDVHVNADHLLAWGASPAVVRAAATANLSNWSATAPWTDEVSGQRRILSSASGGGTDAARILLRPVRNHLVAELGSDARVLVGLPERDLLVAAAFHRSDPEFAALFTEFVRGQADDADQPLDRRVHELIDGELRPFEE